jgi:hypothetical protein
MDPLSEPHYAILTEWDQIDFDVAGEEEEEVRVLHLSISPTLHTRALSQILAWPVCRSRTMPS